MTVLVAEGDWGTVECVVRPSGECPARDFLLNECAQIFTKTKDKPESSALHKFLVLFQEMANTGRVPSKRFSQEAGKIYGFKEEVRNILLRFACFQHGNCWLLTHGFQKPGAQKGRGKWPPREIQRAEEIMKEYWEQQGRSGNSGTRGKGR